LVSGDENMKLRMIAAMLFYMMGYGLAQAPPPDTGIGVDEKLGDTIPLDLAFKDENGRTVRLGDLVDRPTLLMLVYFRCPSVCSPFLNGVVDVMDKLDLKAGKDYNALVISFDDRETPDLALQKKTNYLKLFRNPIDPNGMRFLTGDTAAVQAITGAVGFRYKRQGEDFLHPVTLMAISPKGEITRYLYGIRFNPFDVKMALNEAAAGRPGPTVNRVLLYCFSYDPEGKTYVFNILKVTGTMMIFLILCLAAWLVFTTKKNRKEKPSNVQQ
jgi:protein SCO1